MHDRIAVRITVAPRNQDEGTAECSVQQLSTPEYPTEAALSYCVAKTLLGTATQWHRGSLLLATMIVQMYEDGLLDGDVTADLHREAEKIIAFWEEQDARHSEEETVDAG